MKHTNPLPAELFSRKLFAIYVDSETVAEIEIRLHEMQEPGVFP